MKGKSLSWVTDPHLAHSSEFEAKKLIEECASSDIVLLGGDITHPDKLPSLLESLSMNSKVFYVLGNHDYQGTHISTFRNYVNDLNIPNVTYLSTLSQPVPLSKNTCLIGHDCWGDGLLGTQRILRSLWDFSFIKDFVMQPSLVISHKLRQLGLEAANHLKTQLSLALESYDRVYVLTHVPIFEELCFYKGYPTEPDILPFMCNYQSGVEVHKIAEANPNKCITVLSGHTHHYADKFVLPNLHCMVNLPTINKFISRTFIV